MRISEMRRREPLDSILCQTLEKGFSEQYGMTVRVMPHTADEGVFWYLHPLLNACYTKDVGPEARHFLRDNFRYTPVKWRLPLQWLLGTFLASPLGLRLTGEPALWVSASLPSQESLIVMPGNQRLRVFNFRTHICRVLLKDGFRSATMAREIQVRTSGPGPFPPVLQYAADYSWLEEPIIHGFALPRCRPRIDRHALERQAIHLLNEWLDRSSEFRRTDAYVEEASHTIHNNLEQVYQRFGGQIGSTLPDLLVALVREVSKADQIPVAASHGDFQAGNIMIENKTNRVYLIDWEHSATRFRYYDHMVYGLNVRFAKGLAFRCRRFLAGELWGPALEDLPKDSGWRKTAIATMLLEELSWRLSECLCGPYQSIPESLSVFVHELQQLVSGVESVFG